MIARSFHILKKFYENKRNNNLRGYNVNKTNTISFTNISLPSFNKGSKNSQFFGTGNNSSGTLNSQRRTPKSSFFVPMEENSHTIKKFIDKCPGVYIDQCNSAIIEWNSFKQNNSHSSLNDTPSFLSSRKESRSFEEIRKDEVIPRTKTRTCIVNKSQLHTIVEENFKADSNTIM